MVAPPVGHGSLIGSKLGGYEVEALIGRGAMGTVYLAHDVRLGRRIALKVLLGSLARNPEHVKQFHLEAQAASPLNHPGIVRIYSAGIEDGVPYIVMEFVDGEPLDRFLRRKGRLRWQNALYIARQIAEALDYAHGKGIVHRDVKPSNVMLDRSGGVRITDFGIAAVQSQTSGGASKRNFIGTPQYMSPEQCTGREVGPASDLFSLGVMLYEMISGEKPFHGESPIGLIKSICTETPRRLAAIDPEVPDDVSRLVAYLLEKDPKDRPADGKAFSDLVNRVHKEEGGTSALPDALKAFVQEEAEPRPFSKLHRDYYNASKGRRKRAAGERPWFLKNWRRVLRASVITALAVLALAAGPYFGYAARGEAAGNAPVLDAASFERKSDAVITAQLFADSYEFTRVSWVGDQPVAIVEARGVPGTLTDGATGLLVADPNNREFRSLRSPNGPAMDAKYWDERAPALTHIRVPPTPPATPLHEALLIPAYENASGPVVMLAQSWNEAAPRPAVLFRASRDAWRGPDRGLPARDTARAIASPNGYTMCFVLYDPTTDKHFLYEYDLRDYELGFQGAALRSTLGSIVPESVQYSPSGEFILYLAESYNGTRGLWRVASGGASDRAEKVLDNVLGDEFAVSPDGTRLVAAQLYRAGGGYKSELSLARADDGALETRLGRGTVTADAWRRAGDRVVVFRPKDDPDARPNRGQLWSIQTHAPYAAVQLTREQEGVRPAYALSHDGTWIVSVSGSSVFPSLLFIEWDKLKTRKAV